MDRLEHGENEPVYEYLSRIKALSGTNLFNERDRALSATVSYRQGETGISHDLSHTYASSNTFIL